MNHTADEFRSSSIEMLRIRCRVSCVTCGVRSAEWKQAYAATAKETGGVTDQQKPRPIHNRMKQLRAKKAEFMIEDRTGFMWVYLQK